MLEDRTADDLSAANKKFQKELNAGTVALVMLEVLGRADRNNFV